MADRGAGNWGWGELNREEGKTGEKGGGRAIDFQVRTQVRSEDFSPSIFKDWVHLTLANMFVGAKHDRSQYGIITNNLYAVMLRPLQKWDAPQEFQSLLQTL